MFIRWLIVLSLVLCTLYDASYAKPTKRTKNKTSYKKVNKKRYRKSYKKTTRKPHPSRLVKKPQPTPESKTEILTDGEVKIESRFFEDDKKTETKDTSLGLFTKLKIKAKHGNNWSENLRLVARADKYDPTRSVFFFEEGYIQYKSGNFEYSLGAQMFNWSATEAFHPADIVNSRNYDSNLENAEKIGEPMLMGTYVGEESKFSLFIMPMFMKPILPQYTNRLSLSGGFPMEKPVFIDKEGAISDDDFALQFGARFEYTFDDSDLTLHFIDHIDRSTPTVKITAQGLLPIYLPVQEMGGTYQLVLNSWVVKLAGAHRDFKEVTNPIYGKMEVLDHSQMAFGLEYGWSSTSGSDTTLILEGQSIIGPDEDQRAAINIFQQDLLFGVRYAFNDVYSKEIFASLIYDIERSSEMLINFNFQRRISNQWKMSTGLRIVDAKPKSAVPVGLELIDGANQIYLDLTRYF